MAGLGAVAAVVLGWSGTAAEPALAAGQVLQARVVAVDGAAARRRLGGQTLAAAAHVPLSVGLQVDLLVEQAANGRLLLRLVDTVLRPGAATAGLAGAVGDRGNQRAPRPWRPRRPGGALGRRA